MSRPTAVFLMLLCTALWGLAFVAQKTAMGSMQPLTFAGARYLLGGLAILPLALREYRIRRAEGVVLTSRNWWQIGVVSLVLFFGTWLQQVGLTATTVTNAGFLTSLYVLLVPIIGLMLGHKPHPILIVGVPMALIGVYFLNGARLDQLNQGDLLIIACAVAFAIHVSMLGPLATSTRMPVFVSGVSFLVAAGLSIVGAFAIEQPTIEGLAGGWIQIAYAGIFSTAIAFTLQAVGQQYVPPSNAAIILSAEGLFAAVGGAVLLGERLTPIGYTGAALILLAIVLVEAVPAMRRPAAA